jgi:hypothetical protein
MKTLSFFTRKGCHLCDEALDRVRLCQKEHPFAIRVIDLDHDAAPDKRALYTNEVPVMELDGRKIMKFRLDEARLIRLLQHD